MEREQVNFFNRCGHETGVCYSPSYALTLLRGGSVITCGSVDDEGKLQKSVKHWVKTAANPVREAFPVER